MNNPPSDNCDLLTRTSNLLRTALNQLESGNVLEINGSCSGQGPSTYPASWQFPEQRQSALGDFRCERA